MQFRGTIRKLALCALVLGAAGALSGCVVNGGGYHDGHYDRGAYPPAHAHHGYRYAYPSGPTLIFDSGLGMYGVYGYPDYYFHDGYFYRWSSGYWNRSRYWDRRWERCDSRHWPRPVYYANNNYYGKGRRPHRDWDRPGHDDGDHHGDGHREHGDRFIDAVRDVPRRASEQDQRERTREHDPSGEQRPPDRNVNDDGHREQGDRFMGAVRDQSKRAREQEQRERTRKQNPSDEPRQPDGDFRRGDRERREQPAAQPEYVERVAAERPENAQGGNADRRVAQQAERAERHAVQQAERGERRAAEQTEREQRQEAGRRNDEERRRDDGSSDDRGEPDGEQGGARGDNWRERADRR